MKFNQLNYHRASPFHRQGYLPDRALFNRHLKEFPSDIPKGQDFFTQVGRRHYDKKFNHSQIDEDNILKSPERYPFEHRIALDKSYPRNLDTIDIEGAASSTRMNQSIKNKYRAQEELARRNNQSLDLKEHFDKTYEVQRREIAFKQFQDLEDKKNRKDTHQDLGESRLSENNQLKNNMTYKSNGLESVTDNRMSNNVKSNKQELRNNTISYEPQQLPSNSGQQLSEQYLKYVAHTTTSDKYNKHGAPRIQYMEHQQMQQQLEQQQQKQMEQQKQQHMQAYQSNYNVKNGNQYNHNQYSTIHNPEQPSQSASNYPAQYSSRPYENQKVKEYYRLRALEKQKVEKEELIKKSLGMNNRHKSNPDYIKNFNIDVLRKMDEQQNKTIEMEDKVKDSALERKDFRKQNPTNLSNSSFNMAAQSIVTSNIKNIELAHRGIY